MHSLQEGTIRYPDRQISCTPFAFEDATFKTRASDRDGGALAMAKENANRAGVGDSILFRRADAAALTSELKGGSLVTNPPYGERP
jgi:putative N6-adenine-specific DNA methylase